MEFEWDENKNASNKEKHDVSFEEAKEVFNDENRIEYTDKRKDYGEIRKIIIGNVLSAILYVAFTVRNGVIRLISARRADKAERQLYIENLKNKENGK